MRQAFETAAAEEATPVDRGVAVPGPATAPRAYTELFENAFHFAPVAMALVSLEGRFLRLNSAFCRLVDYSEAELLKMDFQTITHAEDLSADLLLVSRLMAGEIDSYAMEKRYIRRGGHIVHVSLNVSMVRHRDGAPKHFIAQVQDLTERRAHEQALASAIETAEAATQAKSAFLANMSHEIRTPLTAVIGFSGLLKAEPDLDEKARHFADRIASASRGLLAVVNDILDFSRLEAGEYEINARPDRAAEVAREAIAMLRVQAEAKGLTLDFTGDEGAESLRLFDPDRLRQVLLNLIGNAVKFTDTGGVSLRMEARGRRLEVRVIDTGPGLDAEQQARLFARFSQVDGSATRRHGGTGLGLAISKGFVEAMGGEIGVASQPGAGACFHFWIDAAPVIGQVKPAEDEPAPFYFAGLRVLVADDNSFNRELVRTLLESIDCRITEARDGSDAVAVAAAAPFDVVVMDLRMPGLNGDEALREIRRRPGPNQFTPILCFSAAGESVAPAAGFAAVVAKPVSPVRLLQAIATSVQDSARRPAVQPAQAG